MILDVKIRTPKIFSKTIPYSLKVKEIFVYKQNINSEKFLLKIVLLNILPRILQKLLVI